MHHVVCSFLCFNADTQNIWRECTRVRKLHRIHRPRLKPTQLNQEARIQNIPTLKTNGNTSSSSHKKHSSTSKHTRITYLPRQRKLYLYSCTPINTHKRVPTIRTRRIRKRDVRIDVIHRYKLSPASLRRRSATHVLEGQRSPFTDEPHDRSSTVNNTRRGTAGEDGVWRRGGVVRK